MILVRSPCRQPGARICALRVVLTVLVALLFTGATLGDPPDAGRSAAVDEYRVKAAMRFNVAKVTRWPEGSLPDPDGVFVIGILGPDPFGQTLEEVIGNRHLHGARIEIRRSSTASDLGDAHLVFVAGDTARLGEHLSAFAGAPVLTVGDGVEFCRRGGMLGLDRRKTKIKLVINRAAATASRISFSSQVLKLAQLYNSEGRK